MDPKLTAVISSLTKAVLNRKVAAVAALKREALAVASVATTKVVAAATKKAAADTVTAAVMATIINSFTDINKSFEVRFNEPDFFILCAYKHLKNNPPPAYIPGNYLPI